MDLLRFFRVYTIKRGINWEIVFSRGGGVKKKIKWGGGCGFVNFEGGLALKGWDSFWG